MVKGRLHIIALASLIFCLFAESDSLSNDNPNLMIEEGYYKKLEDGLEKKEDPRILLELFNHYFFKQNGKEKALNYLSRAAELGYDRAQYNLAQIHFGKTGPENQKKAFFWYKKAAENGHAESQKMIGDFYEKGTWVEQSSEKAFIWYRKAAYAGHPIAMKKLSEYYASGKLQSVDNESAYLWSMMFAVKIHPDSINGKKHMEDMEMLMEKLSIDEILSANERFLNLIWKLPCLDESYVYCLSPKAKQ